MSDGPITSPEKIDSNIETPTRFIGFGQGLDLVEIHNQRDSFIGRAKRLRHRIPKPEKFGIDGREEILASQDLFGLSVAKMINEVSGRGVLPNLVTGDQGMVIGLKSYLSLDSAAQWNKFLEGLKNGQLIDLVRHLNQEKLKEEARVLLNRVKAEKLIKSIIGSATLGFIGATIVEKLISRRKNR